MTSFATRYSGGFGNSTNGGESNRNIVENVPIEDFLKPNENIVKEVVLQEEEEDEDLNPEEELAPPLQRRKTLGVRASITPRKTIFAAD